MIRLMIGIQLIVSAFAVSSQAGTRAFCDQLLSSSSLTSGLVSQTQLSDSSRAYVNLVQYFIKQSDESSVSKVLSQIFSAKEFINPFVGEINPISIQMSSAIEKLRSRITSSEWRGLQAELEKMAQKTQTEADDRTQKSKDTAAVFAPKIVDRQKVSSHATGGSWYITAGRVLFAVARSGFNLLIYELVNGEFKEIASEKHPVNMRGGPSWLEVNGRVFVSFGGMGFLYNYELINDRLISRAKIEMPSGSFGTPVWQVVGDQVFLAVNTSLYRLHVYELMYKTKASKLERIASLPTKNKDHGASPAWQIINGRVFMAVASSSADLYVFELIDDESGGRKILGVDAVKLSDGASHAVSWQIVDGRYYIAVSAYAKKVSLFEFKDYKLKRRGAPSVQGKIRSALSWFEVDGKTFLAVGAEEKALHLFELVGGKLVEKSRHDLGAVIYSAVSWQAIGERVFLSACAADNKIYFYELVNGELISMAVLDYNTNERAVPSWVLVDGVYYFSVGAEVDEILLIKVQESPKK